MTVISPGLSTSRIDIRMAMSQEPKTDVTDSLPMKVGVWVGRAGVVLFWSFIAFCIFTLLVIAGMAMVDFWASLL